MISLAAIGSGIANSRAAQYAIGAGLLVVGFLFWLARHDAKLLQNERLRAERNARKVQDEIRKSNDEKSTQTDIARDDAPRGIDHVDGLPDDIRAAIIRD